MSIEQSRDTNKRRKRNRRKPSQPKAIPKSETKQKLTTKEAKSDQPSPQPKLVWTRERPDSLVGAKAVRSDAEKLAEKPKKVAHDIPEKPKKPAPAQSSVAEKEPEPTPARSQPVASRPTAPRHQPEATPQPNKPQKPQKPAKPIDYSRFFWAESDVEPKATKDSHDILPPTPQPNQSPIAEQQVQPASEPTPELSSLDRARQMVANEYTGEQPTADTTNPSLGEAGSSRPKPAEASPFNSQAESMPEAPSATRPPAESSSSTRQQYNSAPQEMPSFETGHEPDASSPASRVELNGPQLVNLAKSIKVDNKSSLFDLYNNRELDAEGMHNVAQEYLVNHDIDGILKHELIETQKKYERDPSLKRHVIRASAGRLGQGTSRAASRVSAKTSQHVNKKTIKRGAKRIQHHGAGIFDFYSDIYDEYPLPFQVAGVIFGVILYFILLLIIIRL